MKMVLLSPSTQWIRSVLPSRLYSLVLGFTFGMDTFNSQPASTTSSASVVVFLSFHLGRFRSVKIDTILQLLWHDHPAVSQPFFIQAFLFSDISVLQKRLDGKTWYFGPKTNTEHTTKWAPLGLLKPSIPRSTWRARAHIPIEQPATVTLSVRGCLGGRSARGVRGSPAEGRPYVLYEAYGTKDKTC
jgi:hypothetical protein